MLGGSVGERSVVPEDINSSDDSSSDSSQKQPAARAKHSPQKTKTQALNNQTYDVHEDFHEPIPSSSSRCPNDQDIGSDHVGQADEIPGVREGEEAISIGAAGGRTTGDDSVAEDQKSTTESQLGN